MLRPISDSDKPIIAEWISKDADHLAKELNEEFFYRPDGFSFAIADERGPVMYIKIEPCDAEIVRFHIQFDERERGRRRTVLALMRDIPTVLDLVKKSNIRYIVFDSVSETLIRFCQKHFGFVHIADSNDYQLDLKAGP
ncbi:MAG: hypothetical protein WCA27_07355 [Candidatus Sulfotelmatobacter sp.]